MNLRYTANRRRLAIRLLLQLARDLLSLRLCQMPEDSPEPNHRELPLDPHPHQGRQNNRWKSQSQDIDSAFPQPSVANGVCPLCRPAEAPCLLHHRRGRFLTAYHLRYLPKALHLARLLFRQPALVRRLACR